MWGTLFMLTSGRVSRREWYWAIGVAFFVVMIATMPYVVAWLAAPTGKCYTGLLVNPLDGHSYLAKMQQGAAGEWLFRLPFTPEIQQGAFLFTYYLFLGHLSSLFGIPLIFMFHIARCLAGMLLLLTVYRFVAEFLVELEQRRVAFLIVALSSGLGWVLAIFGTVGVDLWVPESNTFYSIFVNPHFPLAEALMLLIFMAAAAPLDGKEAAVPCSSSRALARDIGRCLLCVVASLALVCVQPFAVLAVYPVLGFFLLWRSSTGSRWLTPAWIRTFCAGVASFPLVVYYASVSRNDPIFAAWSVQNITPTPALWAVLAGYGFLILLAGLGGVWCFRRRRGFFLLIWVGVNLVLLYTPFALQRRLLLGFHIPVAMLASCGVVGVLWTWFRSRQRAVSTGVLLILLPTTLFVLLVQIAGAMQAKWPLYMTADENGALRWLKDATTTDELVVASPEMGLMIPAWAGNRVVYGHPFETVRAEQRKADVENFFSGRTAPDDFFGDYDVSYVFVGSHERALGESGLAWSADSRYPVAYSNAEVLIYRISRGQRN